jgi:hypothetical protein
MLKFNSYKKLNDNRAAMIRAYLNKAQQCLIHIPRRVNVWEVLAKNEEATDLEIHCLHNQLLNERNFYRNTVEHLDKAVEILENLKK